MSMQMMMQAPMTTTTTTTATSTSTLPCVASCVTAAAIAVGGMAEQHAMLSHFDTSNKNAAVVVGNVKGQNGADGNDDGGVVVVAKTGLKTGRKMVVLGGGNSKSSTKITTTTTTTAPFMSDSYAGGADADAGIADAAGARDAQYKHKDDEDEDGYDDKHQDGGVKLARSNTANENNDGTAMDKEGGLDAKNTILLRGSSKPLACCVM